MNSYTQPNQLGNSVPIGESPMRGSSQREPFRTIEVKRRQEETGGSDISWELTASTNDSGFYWKVSSTDSTVQDGTNGALIALAGLAEPPWLATTAIKFDTETTLTATRYIYLKAAVNTSLVLTNWTFEASATEKDEVEFDANSPYSQIWTRLYIGKVTIAGSPEFATVTQHAKNRQCIIRLFLNSMSCKGFQSI